MLRALPLDFARAFFFGRAPKEENEWIHELENKKNWMFYAADCSTK